MPGACGQRIVQRAAALEERYPHAASLQILDAAMEGFKGEHPDFECEIEGVSYGDWLDPPSPFADLLRRAFGMHLPESDFNVESERWQHEVIDAFAQRYQLWR